MNWELNFLALCIWREARGESMDAKIAVAWSIRNRVLKPGWWGNSWASVLSHKLQYSSLTAPGDPNLIQWPLESDTSWSDSIEAAAKAYSPVETDTDPTLGATNYFSQNDPPLWATKMRHTIDIGPFHFYQQL